MNSVLVFFLVVIPTTIVTTAMFLFFFRFITNERRIMPQKEVRFFYDGKTKKISLLNFRYINKIHFAFFNHFEFKKFIFPKKIEFFVRFLKTFNVKYQNVNKVVSFFSFIGKTELYKQPTLFVLPQKTNFHNKVTATEVHVGYIPDPEGSFTVFFKLIEKKIFDLTLKNKRSAPDFLARYTQGGGVFFIINLENQPVHELEEASLNFIKKLHNSTKIFSYKWLIFERLLVIFAPNNKIKHFQKRLPSIAKTFFIGKVLTFHAKSFQQLGVSFSFFLRLLNNITFPSRCIRVEEDKELVQKIRKNVELLQHWQKHFSDMQNNGWEEQKFFDGDISVKYISPLFFLQINPSISDFIKERIVDGFYDAFLNKKEELRSEMRHTLIELTFQKFIEIANSDKIDSFKMKPFLVVNFSTPINYLFLKQALKKYSDLDYSLRINSVLNQDFYKALPLLNPKYVLVSKEVSQNLNKHTVWAQFQTIFVVLKGKKAKFIFENITPKLEKSKEMSLKPFETINIY